MAASSQKPKEQEQRGPRGQVAREPGARSQGARGQEPGSQGPGAREPGAKEPWSKGQGTQGAQCTGEKQPRSQNRTQCKILRSKIAIGST